MTAATAAIFISAEIILTGMLRFLSFFFISVYYIVFLCMFEENMRFRTVFAFFVFKNNIFYFLLLIMNNSSGIFIVVIIDFANSML